jgi:hypothetical protein
MGWEVPLKKRKGCIRRKEEVPHFLGEKMWITIYSEVNILRRCKVVKDRFCFA